MVYCRRCGKTLGEQDLFCPHCGAAVRGQLSPPPVYPHEAPKDDRTLLIVVVVLVVVVVVLPVLFSGLLYLMVAGFGPSVPSTSTHLVVSKPSADIINFAVTGTSTEVDLTEVWIEVRYPAGELGMSAGNGLDAGDSRLGGTEDITVLYYDMDTDRMLSDNDRIVIESALGPLEWGQYEVLLKHGPNGAVIADAAATVP